MLYGAPRRDGATGRLLALLCEAVEDDVAVVDAFERHVRPCDDCRGCHKVTHCVKHDMDDVYEAIEQADRLVLVTPVYNRSFPAPLKAMIDRLQCYWAARFIHGIKRQTAKPETALLLTVCGSDRDDGACLEYQLSPQLTLFPVTAFKALHVTGTDGEVDWKDVKIRLETALSE